MDPLWTPCGPLWTPLGPFVAPYGPFVAPYGGLVGPFWLLWALYWGPKLVPKVKPRFGDFGKKKSISPHGRPNLVAKGPGFHWRLYNMGLRTWIWGSLALGVGYFE